MIDCKECEKDETRKECNGRDMRRQEMIDQIKSLDFAIIELGLYLDTHPDDQRALCMHKEYCKQAKNLKSCYALAVSSVYIGEKVIHRKEWYNG